jgi:TrmH family RNA methyltransferase
MPANRSETISSVHNPAIKQIRQLQQRKERERTGLYFVEGIRLVAEAIQTDAALERVVVAPELLVSPFARSLVEQWQRGGGASLEVTAAVFKSFAAKEHPQGLAAVIRQRWTALDEIRLDQALCWVALAAVQDPGNLGTILRTSDAVGSGGVSLLGHSTEPYYPEAVRASIDAIFAQRVAQATLPQLAAWKQAQACMMVGTSGAAQADYRTYTYRFPLLILMGSEQHGLAPDEMALCDALVRIPMVGRSDSLNLAVATGVVLYEVFHQRQTHAPSHLV